MNDKIVIYRSADGETRLDVKIDRETVWLNVSQMAELFGRDSKTIRKHINNAIREELADEEADPKEILKSASCIFKQKDIRLQVKKFATVFFFLL